jgi:hypothetical protein
MTLGGMRRAWELGWLRWPELTFVKRPERTGMRRLILSGFDSTKAMRSPLSCDDDGCVDYQEFTRVYGISINLGKLL